MEYFYSDGGSNRPFFLYRFKIKESNTEMFTWCENFPSNGPFSRFHLLHSDNIIQFESKDAYLAFKFAFAGEYIEDLTWEDYR